MSTTLDHTNSAKDEAGALKRAIFWQRLLFICSCAFVFIAVFGSIYTDGLNTAFSVIFPFTILILGGLISSLVIGIRNRKLYKRWFLWTIGSLLIGSFLWSPMFRSSRRSLEYNWKYANRQYVVDDIKAGILLIDASTGIVAVPRGEYGHVSFETSFNETPELENVVRVTGNDSIGITVSLRPNVAFLEPKSTSCIQTILSQITLRIYTGLQELKN